MTLPYFQPSKTKDKSAAQKMTTKLTQPNICVPGKRKCSVKNKPNPIMYMIPTTGMKGVISIIIVYANTLIFLHSMKYELWMIGKTNEKYIVDGCNEYIKRISRFANLQVLVWTDVKVSPDMPAETVKLKEGESIIQKLGKDDYLVLLDEKGSQIQRSSCPNG